MSEPSSVDQTTPPAQASASEDPSVAAVAAPPEDKLTLGQQIAGGLLLVNAIFVLLSEFLIPADPKLGPLFAPGRSVMPAIIDLAIGVSLLRGKPKYRTWALVRVLLGTVLFTAAAWGKDPLMTASQIMIGASLLLFLLGDAGRVRLVAGGAVFFLYSLLNLSGLSATLFGVNPLGTYIQVAVGMLEAAPAGTVTGTKIHYQITAPNPSWRLRTASSTVKENPMADRWLTRPDFDAHVVVIAEREPGQQISLPAMTKVVIENAQRVSKSFVEIDRAPLKTHPQHGVLIHTQATVENIELEYLSGVITTYEHGYQVIAFAPRKSFAKVERELRSIIESFKLPTDEVPTPPADVEPTPTAQVTGQASKYVLSAPQGVWYLRKDEAAKQTNPLSDRWLTRPDLDAHIMVIAELVEGAELDADKYADAVAQNLRSNQSAEIVSIEKVAADPDHGRVLHVKLTSNNLPIEYRIGCFARGEEAWQVLAFSSQENYPELEADFEKAIDSFQLPPPRPARIAIPPKARKH